MARQPKQVHIYLYRKNQGEYQYAIFQRADNPIWWQGICGGLEDDETAEQGAVREVFEEAGITNISQLYPLDSVSVLPAGIFSPEEQELWGTDVVVIPMSFFAIPFDGEVKLSEEHIEVRWLNYESAYQLVYSSDQKTALYELNERLLRGNLRRRSIN